MDTLLVEIEAVINARPLTYMYDDVQGISYPLTPSQMINGRNLAQTSNHRHAEVLSTYEALSRRAKYHHNLLTRFTQRWKKEYVVGLMEVFKSKQILNRVSLSIGDIVLMKNEQTKRCFWKMGKITELLPGKDGNVRAARLEIPLENGGKRIFTRSIQHLVPLEIHVDRDVEESAKQKDTQLRQRSEPSQARETQQCVRPRRSAAVVGELLRRDHSF